MIKRILTIIFLLAFTQPVFSQGGTGEFALPKDLTMILPKDGSVKPEWVAAPLLGSSVAKANLTSLRFHMGKRGEVWMSYRSKFMSDLASGMTFSLSRPISDFVFFDDGALFIASDTALGFIPPVNKEKISPKNLVFPFQPVCLLPAQRCSIASDGKNAIFVYGYEPATKTYGVFKLLKGFSGWSKVFVSDEKINSVFVNAGDLYIAAGRLVFKLHLGEKGAKIIFSHPKETVTDVVYLPGTGLFYATNSGGGLVVNGGALEFIRFRSAHIAIKDGKLYVFMPDSLGVLRLTNIEGLISDKIKKKEQS
jgi:hypothetical protein